MAWQKLEGDELERYRSRMSRLARHRGVEPTAVYANKMFLAMQYHERDKWERWSLQLIDGDEIALSWSTVLIWLRDLIGDRRFIEVYPRDEEIVDTAPVRWFWVMPHHFHWHMIDLRPE